MNTQMTKDILARQCVDAMLAKDTCTKKMGMNVTEITHNHITVKMRVTNDMINGFSSCHGGQIFTLADSTFAFACNVHNEATVAAGGDIHYINAAKLEDTLTARSTRIHHTGRLGIYDIRITNQDNLLIAQFRGRAYTIKGKPVITQVDENTGS